MGGNLETREEQRQEREQERFLFSVPVKLVVESGSGITPVMDFSILNISAGGAFVTTSLHLPLASRVRLEFFLSLAELAQLRFVVAEESLKVWQGERAWVAATGVIIRREASGIAVIFEQNYQFVPLRMARENGLQTAPTGL